MKKLQKKSRKSTKVLSWAIRKEAVSLTQKCKVKQEVLFVLIETEVSYTENLAKIIVAQLVNNLPVIWKTWVQSLHWEDPLEKGKATHSSILAWRISWTIQSMGSQRVGHDWATFTSLHTKQSIFSVDRKALYGKKMSSMILIARQEKSVTGCKYSKDLLALLLRTNAVGDF